MVKNDARKTEVRELQERLGVTYMQALAILDAPDDEPEYPTDAEYCGRCGTCHDDEEPCSCDGCPDCGGGCGGGCENGCGPYDMCVCEPEPETPRRTIERAADLASWGGAPTQFAALAAVHRGLTVFPLPAGGRVPTSGWRGRLVSTPEQVAASWPEDGSNVAVACGPSGIVVLDDDFAAGHPDNAGKRSTLTALADELGETVPETFYVDTPSGGRHLYFLAPEGVTVPSSSGTTVLGSDIDVRAGAGYVVGPYSVVPDPTGAGERSVYLPGDIPSRPLPLAPLPAWILGRITTTATQV